jgi:hypothetical protein
MGVYRTYFDKNNTIVENTAINTGRNQVSELYFGGSLSRFLFFCSFEELRNKIINKEIVLNSSVKHYLKIKNTSSFDISPFLSENNNLLLGDKFRSSSFDLELRPVLEFWDEGMGYDFQESPLSRPQNRDFSEEPSNWFNRTNINNFTFPGGLLGDVINQQHFDLGNEDINLDVTEYVNELLLNEVITGTTTGITTNYNGFCLKYTQEYEDLSFDDDRIYALGLFTRHTQTFFEPFIETIYDDYIEDDRVDFFLEKQNKLYLYVNIGGVMSNLDELPQCTISEAQLSEPLIVKQQTKGVYYVEFFADSNIFDSYTQYTDVWSNIKFKGVLRPEIKLNFIPKESTDYYQVGSDVSDPIRYGVSLSGIKREEKINQGEVRKVNVHLRKPYTVSEKDVITNIFYKLYIKQGPNQVEILDWQRVNKLYNNNSFNINTTWLIPQVYYVDIKIERNGEINLFNEELKFTILSKI